MPNGDFNLDLTKLDGDYQILTELHGEGDSRTYLARHLRLNRDVTISVFRAADADEIDSFNQFASDTHLLAEARHPHIVPILEGAWLDEATFATVRARVRGATLDQSLAASGPMPLARVASTIRDAADAILWARDAGVAQRGVAPWDIVFQQGSGRVLLSFEPAHAVGVPRAECNDAQTLRRLTIEMLAGEIDRTKSAQEIPVPRSIPSDVADALAALRQCTRRNEQSSLNALLAALDAGAQKAGDETTQIALMPAPPVASATAVEPAPHIGERIVPTIVERSADSPKGQIPVVTSVPHRRSRPSQRDDAVIVAKPSLGFNARFGTAVVLIVLVGAFGIVMLNRNGSSPTNIAADAPRDSGGNAAGEVALRPVPPTESAPPRQTASPPPAASPLSSPRLTPPPRITSTALDTSAGVQKAITPDSVVPRKKRVVLDSAAEAERQFQRDSAADVADPCLSAEAASQRLCLTTAIEKNDRELNAVFGRLISALRRQSGAASADPDPDAVNDLRAAERSWADTREAACREIGEEPLYARSRAACYAQKATDRARELREKLDAIPPAEQPLRSRT